MIFWILMGLLAVLCIAVQAYIIRSGNIKLEHGITNTLIVLISIACYGNFRSGDTYNGWADVFLLLALLFFVIIKSTECEIIQYKLKKKMGAKHTSVSYNPFKKEFNVKYRGITISDTRNNYIQHGSYIGKCFK